MSYTSVGIANDSYSETKQPNMIPASELKVGMQVECFVDRQNGDDDDGRYYTVLTIESVVIGTQHIQLTFDGPLADEPDMIKSTGWVKVAR